jgi:hypothetical protein
MNGHDPRCLTVDRVWSIQLRWIIDPGAQLFDRSVEVEVVCVRPCLDLEAQLAETAQPLGAIGTEGDHATDAGVLEERARSCAGAALEAPAAQLANDRASLRRPVVRIAVARAGEIPEIHSEERRTRAAADRDRHADPDPGL